MLEEEEVPGKGVGLRMQRAAEAGTVLLEEEPAAWAVCPGLEPRVCRGCCVVADECFPHGSPCAHCAAAHYCSAACRAEDTPRHAAAECAVLAAYAALRPQWADEMGSDDETFLLCLLGLLCAPPAVRAAVARLAAGPAFEAAAAADPSLPGLRAAAAAVLAAAGLPAALLPEPAEWRALCAREQCNAFGLFEAAPGAGLHCFGRAVFAAAARFNHSCRPAVARLRRGRRLVFVAARRLAAGEAACVTYVALGEGRGARRAELREGYGFDCDCERCAEEAGEEREDEEEREDAQGVCAECGGELLLGRCVHHDRVALLQLCDARAPP